MKHFLKILLLTVSLLLSFTASAQQKYSSSESADVLQRATDLEVMLAALAQVQPVPFDSLPKNRFGRVNAVGFWSMQNPKLPPFPGNFYNLDVWPLGNGAYVLDDRAVDYPAIQMAWEEEQAQQQSFAPMMRMAVNNLSVAYGNPVYLTNLVVLRTNGVSAAFDIAGGTNNVPYDILATTNLALPVSAWSWLGIGYTSNRYSFSNQPSDLAFYILAKPARTLTVAWGENYFNQCEVPPGLTNAVAVTGGGGYTVALLNDGRAVGWGDRVTEGSVPTNLTGIAMIASGIDHKVALLTNGTVLAYGANFYGQTDVPASATNIVVISALYLHTLALRRDGTAISWGNTSNPGLTNIPSALTNGVAVAAGCQHNLAVKADGTVLAWGDNDAGQCNVPAGLTNVVDVAAGWKHSVALKRDGTVVCWGNNTFGESAVPAGLSNVVAIAAAGYPLYSGFTMVLKRDGTVQLWGKNKAAQQLTGGLNNVIAIGVEYDSAMAIRSGPPTPVITLQPVSQYQMTGGSVSYGVKGQGLYGVTYQWQFGGVNLPGQTNQTLTLTNVQSTNAGNYRVVITDNGGYGSITSSNASLTLVSPPTFVYQSAPTNLITIYGKRISMEALATAPGQANGFPLYYQWRLNGTNLAGATTNFYAFNLADESAGSYSLVASNAAGSASVSWQITLTNAINVTNDLLLIYNTNSVDSTFCVNYYLTHRPNVSGANVLGIGYTNPISPNYFETATQSQLTNQLFNPLLTWLANNPTKRPQYVILFMDLPSRVDYTSAFPTNGYPQYSVLQPKPPESVSVQMQSLYVDWQPYVTHLNMGMTNTVNRTNDFVGYINKLASIGIPIASNSPVLSASLGGYGNTNYILDGVRFAVADNIFENFRTAVGVVSNAIPALLAAGVTSTAIKFYDGLIVSNYWSPAITNWITAYEQNGQHFSATNNNMMIHATNGANLAGYVSWGVHATISPNDLFNGRIGWQGNSGWWLINTIESWNGTQYADQSCYSDWFSYAAFSGTNYSNTPIGAVATVYEPNLDGKNDNGVYLGLWARGQNFGISSWVSKRHSYFMAVGDPLIVR